MDCVKVTFKYFDITRPEPEIIYQDMSASFVVVMAAIQIVLFAIPKTSFRVVSAILSAFIGPIAASGLAEFDVAGITGGMAACTREVTGAGYAAVALSWIIVVLQIIATILWHVENRALNMKNNKDVQ